MITRRVSEASHMATRRVSEASHMITRRVSEASHMATRRVSEVVRQQPEASARATATGVFPLRAPPDEPTPLRATHFEPRPRCEADKIDTGGQTTCRPNEPLAFGAKQVRRPYNLRAEGPAVLPAKGNALVIGSMKNCRGDGNDRPSTIKSSRRPPLNSLYPFATLPERPLHESFASPLSLLSGTPPKKQGTPPRARVRPCRG